MVTLVKLRKRSDFLRVAKGKRLHGRYFLLQAAPPQSVGQNKCSDEVGIGLTVTKKVGNAVVRNRCKRRMRVIVRKVLSNSSVRPMDIVLIAKQASVECRFSLLELECNQLINKADELLSKS